MIEGSRVEGQYLGYLRTFTSCQGLTLPWFSSSFSDWNSWTPLLAFSSLPWNDLVPSFQDWQLSLLSAIVPFSAFTAPPLFLCPFILLFDLIACCLPLSHYSLSFMDTRTVSYLFSYFLKCLAHRGYPINIGWNEMAFFNSTSSSPKCTKLHILSINHQISQSSPLTHTHFVPFFGAHDCRHKPGSIHDFDPDNDSWCWN